MCGKTKHHVCVSSLYQSMCRAQAVLMVYTGQCHMNWPSVASFRTFLVSTWKEKGRKSRRVHITPGHVAVATVGHCQATVRHKANTPYIHKYKPHKSTGKEVAVCSTLHIACATLCLHACDDLRCLDTSFCTITAHARTRDTNICTITAHAPATHANANHPCLCTCKPSMPCTCKPSVSCRCNPQMSLRMQST